MSCSGRGYPGIFSDLHFDVQIDTKLFRAESAVFQGFQRFASSFNRTVVMNLSQLASTILVVGLALLPTIVASLISGPRDWEPEEEYDYR